MGGVTKQIEYGFDISCLVLQPTDFHCLLDVHPDQRQHIQYESEFRASGSISHALTHDNFGNRMRRITAGPGQIVLSCRGVLQNSGQPEFVPATTRELLISELPGDVLPYLLPSRYCDIEHLSNFAWQQFGSVAPGVERVRAIGNWVHNHIVFGYPHARATRTATEAFNERRGVCRDFAHRAITLCRCLNMPARYVNGYLGDIGVPCNPAPMDFNAWFEVYLDGGWFTFDARHNIPRIGRIVVARGRDAADVAMIHSFGPHMLQSFQVISNVWSAPDVTALEIAA